MTIPPISGYDFYLKRKLNSTLSSIERGQQILRSARTIREVVAALSQVHIDHLLRHESEVRTKMSKLKQDAQAKAQEMLDAQIKEMGSCVDAQAFQTLFGRYRREWEYLRGHLPLAYQQAYRLVQPLRNRFKSTEPDEI